MGMFHLLKEDRQLFGYFGIMGLYFLFGVSYYMLRNRVEGESKEEELGLEWHRKIYDKPIFRVLFWMIVLILHIQAMFVEPPLNLQYLWHLLMAFVPFCFSFYTMLLLNMMEIEWLFNIMRNQHHKNM